MNSVERMSERCHDSDTGLEIERPLDCCHHLVTWEKPLRGDSVMALLQLGKYVDLCLKLRVCSLIFAFVCLPTLAFTLVHKCWCSALWLTAKHVT